MSHMWSESSCSDNMTRDAHRGSQKHWIHKLYVSALRSEVILFLDSTFTHTIIACHSSGSTQINCTVQRIVLKLTSNTSTKCFVPIFHQHFGPHQVKPSDGPAPKSDRACSLQLNLVSFSLPVRTFKHLLCFTDSSCPFSAISLLLLKKAFIILFSHGRLNELFC